MAVETARVTITELEPGHWPEVARIYAEGIATGNATLRDGGARLGGLGYRPPARASLRRAPRRVGGRMGRREHCLGSLRLRRCRRAQRLRRGERARTAESERSLLERLVASTEAAGIWTIQTGIFPENEASLRLHERVGFRLVGTARTARQAQRCLARRAHAGAPQRPRRLRRPVQASSSRSAASGSSRTRK